MRTPRVLAALLLGLVLTMPTAQAAPDPDLTITAVTVGRTSVAVSGLNLVAVPIEVKGGYKSVDPDDKLVLLVQLDRTGGIGTLQYMFSTDLQRTAGTAQEGVWDGFVYVPSTANGTFKVSGVSAGGWFPGGGSTISPTPVNGPVIAVTGTHPPKITASVVPRVVPVGSPYTIRWAVIDASTGKPYATRVTAEIEQDSQCVDSTGGPAVQTDSNGIIAHRYPATDAPWANCLVLRGKPFDIAALGLYLIRSGPVSAVPSKPGAPVGAIVAVNGAVAGMTAPCAINLQRLYGATQWRTVSSAKVRQSGRFTVNAQPAYKGLIPYRVSFPACANFISAVSKVFYVRGL